jgi:hypothetical protein
MRGAEQPMIAQFLANYKPNHLDGELFSYGRLARPGFTLESEGGSSAEGSPSTMILTPAG